MSNDTFGFNDEYIEFEYIDLSQNLDSSSDECKVNRPTKTNRILIMHRISRIPSICEEFDTSDENGDSEECTEFKNTTIQRIIKSSMASKRKGTKILIMGECDEDYLYNYNISSPQNADIHLINEYDHIQSLSTATLKNVDFNPISALKDIIIIPFKGESCTDNLKEYSEINSNQSLNESEKSDTTIITNRRMKKMCCTIS
jgi:hypothetical protein